MKQTFFLLIAFLFCTSVCAQTRYLLSVGVSHYPNAENDLTYTYKDAINISNTYEKCAHVRTLSSNKATKGNMRKRLSEIVHKATSQDQIIFFYSGHGLKGGLYTFDGQLSYSEILDTLMQSEAKNIVCFIDACHSGSAGKIFRERAQKIRDTGDEASKNRLRSIAFLVSSKEEEISSESERYDGGYFATALHEALRGAYDKNKDNIITFGEVVTYVKARVEEKSKDAQHPHMIGSEKMKSEDVMKLQ